MVLYIISTDYISEGQNVNGTSSSYVDLKWQTYVCYCFIDKFICTHS